MLHQLDCACDFSDTKEKKNYSSRREFLCLAVGGVIGIAGASSSAHAGILTNSFRPTLRAYEPPSTQYNTPSIQKISLSESEGQYPVTDPLTIVLPKFPDMHTHLRQGEPLSVFVERHLAMGSDIVVAMPNTVPPVSRVSGAASEQSWSIESYRDMIKEAGGDKFRKIIVPLYLTADTTAAMIDEGAASGLLEAVKFYPPNATTNSSLGVSLDDIINSDVLRAMEGNNIVFCLHGEKSNIKPQDYFDRDKNAETLFYREKMPRLVDRYPHLRISCEHVTTEASVTFVKQCDENVVATVTPQHMLYTVGDLLQTWHADLFCRPLVKFEADRMAVLNAVIDPKNRKFIAGTDSAPHPRIAKSIPCGCAAGCYVGGIAPQLYIQAFETAGVDFSVSKNHAIFRRFMAENAWRFWNIEPSHETIRLIKTPSEVTMITLPDGQQIEPLPVAMMGDGCGAKTAALAWSLEL
jgi:dihydroorotase